MNTSEKNDYLESPSLSLIKGYGITSNWSEIERVIKSKNNKLTHLSVVFDWRSFSWKWKYESLIGDQLFVCTRNGKDEPVVHSSHDGGITWRSVENTKYMYQGGDLLELRSRTVL